MSDSEKSLTPKDIIFGNYEHLENANKDKFETLRWGGYTDVLYSFLGIFALGIYIFEEDKDSKFKIGKDKIIRLADSKQWLYSRKYIKENYSEFLELQKELIEFAKVYTLIGNIAPIWPGGNEFKGKSGCYDIPDIFFCKYKKMEQVYIEQYLEIKVEDTALARFILKSTAPYVNDIETVLNYKKEDYKAFLQHIVQEINLRTEEIERIINTNSNLSLN